MNNIDESVQLKVENKQFFNFGYLEVEYPEHMLKPIKDEVKKIKDSNFTVNKSHADKLAGNLEKEFSLVDSVDHLIKLTYPLTQKYEELYQYSDYLAQTSGYRGHDQMGTLLFDTAWVNFQKKHEFNPTHVHDAIYSFSLYLEIPYDIEDENNLPMTKYSNSKCAGQFEFTYVNSLGKVSHSLVPTDRKFVNKLILFPSIFNHAVYPFYTSDKYRISIAGNYVMRLGSEVFKNNQKILYSTNS
jgi:hypothetical protein